MSKFTGKQKWLLALYVVLNVIVGIAKTSEEFRSNFEGTKILILVVILFVYYGLLLVVTLWIVTGLTALFDKIVMRKKFNKLANTIFCAKNIVVILFVHIFVIMGRIFMNASDIILIMYVIAVASLFITAWKEISKKNISFLALLPLVIYLIVDFIMALYS